MMCRLLWGSKIGRLLMSSAEDYLGEQYRIGDGVHAG